MLRKIRLLLIVSSLFFSTGIAWAANQINFQVNGLSGEVGKNVNQALQNEKKQISKPITQEGVQEFYKNSLKLIRVAMQPFGYFHPTIKSRLSIQGNQWIAVFNVTEGPPVRISQLDIQILGPAKDDPSYISLYAHLPLKVGDILNTEKYEKTKQLLYDLASTRGYFDAGMVEKKIYINLKTNQAQIVILFQSGQRHVFGDTMFSDNPFSTSFLMRFLRYTRGEDYDYSKIEQTQEDFTHSNYFSEVVINPVTDQKDNLLVPINIKLTPRKRYAYSAGVGYGSDSGPRALLDFDVRRVNKYGHQFKALIQGAEKNSFASASYFIPGRHPASDTWAFTTGYADFDQVTGTGKSFKVQGSYTTALGNWNQTVALTYLRERYNLVGFPFTETEVLYPNINWQYVLTSSKVNPKNGLGFSGFMGGAPDLGLTNVSFFQTRVNAKVLFTLFDSTRFIFRTSLARTEVKDIQQIPFSLQLFAGGPRSIRGYSYNQIGPGRNLFVGSIEIQQRITGNWYLVGFFDAGNVTNDNPFQHLNEGVGPGIAWLSPVGVLELTIAKAITQPNKPWVIQFSIGPEI